MRRAVAATLLLLAACRSETGFGPCIGLVTDPDPKLRYELSIRNAVIGVVFVETIIVPVWVLAEDIKCPIARKP